MGPSLLKGLYYKTVLLRLIARKRLVPITSDAPLKSPRGTHVLYPRITAVTNTPLTLLNLSMIVRHLLNTVKFFLNYYRLFLIFAL
jgi:hypothetical protein